MLCRFGHPLHVADQVGYRIVILDLVQRTWLDLLEAGKFVDLLASFVRIILFHELGSLDTLQFP
ncbi:hypothetical protein D3C72_2332460 [compost metagenome]